MVGKIVFVRSWVDFSLNKVLQLSEAALGGQFHLFRESFVVLLYVLRSGMTRTRFRGIIRNANTENSYE